MYEITDAVILMAGAGSRLRASGEVLPKPLVPILGRPLISYVVDALEKVGVRNLHAVIGAEGDALVAALRPLVPLSMRLNPISNPNWHLFDSSVLERVAEQANRSELNLGIDRKIKTIFDLDDAMKVQTDADRVIAIGKDLANYDAVDTGVFLCPNELFDYLRRVRKNGDCSLADGVRLMAGEGKVRAIDIGDAWWQDIDNFAMRRRAEEELSKRPLFKLNALPGRS